MSWTTPYSEAMEAERLRTRALFVAGMWVDHKRDRGSVSVSASRQQLVDAPQNRLAKAIRYALSMRWLG